VPYQLVGGTRFYERREVKDVLAYLRLIHNPLDEISLERVINVPPRGIGPSAWAALRAWADVLGVPLWSALQAMMAEPELDGAPAVDTRGRNALGGFHDVLVQLVAARETLSLPDLVSLTLAETGYADWVLDGTEEGKERWENILELRGVAADYERLPPREALSAFLEGVALVADVDTLGETSDRVTLLTLHAAKGLEYPVVFITGLEEGVLPHNRSLDDPEALSEERRLFYVGLTRAEHKLYLVHCFRRTLFGAAEVREPSRFLLDIPQAMVEGRAVREPAGARTARPGSTTWASDTVAANGDAQFRAGDKVQHPSFGEGVVVRSTSRDGDEEVTVAFVGAGVKTLLQSFARLEKR
jgi:DNA helicase-2/ATP-dependent DNA helicase PcrA